MQTSMRNMRDTHRHLNGRTPLPVETEASIPQIPGMRTTENETSCTPNKIEVDDNEVKRDSDDDSDRQQRITT